VRAAGGDMRRGLWGDMWWELWVTRRDCGVDETQMPRRLASGAATCDGDRGSNEAARVITVAPAHRASAFATSGGGGYSRAL